MVEVWYGDLYVGVASKNEFDVLAESDPWYWFKWCEGYGP